MLRDLSPSFNNNDDDLLWSTLPLAQCGPDSVQSNYTMDDYEEDLCSRLQSPGFMKLSDECFSLLVRVDYKLHLRAKKSFYSGDVPVFYEDISDLIGDRFPKLFAKHFLLQHKRQNLYLYPSGLKITLFVGKNKYEDVSKFRANSYHKVSMEQPNVVCLNVSIDVLVLEREFSAVLREQRRSENQEIT
ncbi:hypothetical protein GEMRC1_000285 [Eukaryota sp. GEM-RC1]